MLPVVAAAVVVVEVVERSATKCGLLSVLDHHSYLAE